MQMNSMMPNASPEPENQFPKKLVLWVVIIVVLLLVLYGLSSLQKKQAQKQSAAEVKQNITKASKGQTIAGFPKNLILPSLVGKVTESYSIDYSTGLKQYTATFVAAAKISDVFNDYVKLLGSKDQQYYLFTKQLTKDAAYIYAKNSKSQSVSVTASVVGGKTNVIVGFLQDK